MLPRGSIHTATQFHRLKKRRREIYRAGKFINLMGCHIPVKYTDEVLSTIANKGWEVACDQAPYPMLCINCSYVHKSERCRGRMEKYYVYGGHTYGRVIRSFTIFPTGLSQSGEGIIFEMAYETDEDARIDVGNETFKRWTGQHDGSIERNRGGQHHTRKF